MIKKIFGTDGIRGRINGYKMNPGTVAEIGIAIAHYFRHYSSYESGVIRVIIAKDTRLSGYMVESALVSGLVASGIDVTLVGPLPTASIPSLIHSLRANFGVMITASHNPHYDNGLKIFDHNGCKISDVQQMRIADIITDIRSGKIENVLSEPEDLGKVRRMDDAAGRYIEYVKSVYSRERRLSGMKIVLDCANGAAYKVAPIIFWELGAEVVSINNEPNGKNINENAGSIFPESLSDEVKKHSADIGIAFDGDADRVLMCDEVGNVIDSDHVIAFIAKYMHETEQLTGGGIVVTSASNHALVDYMKSIGLGVWIAEIGDRNVFSTMQELNCNFGGEKSGHIILGDYTTTGDGILAALQVINIMIETKQKLSDISSLFDLYPQVMHNHKFDGGNPLDNASVMQRVEMVVSRNADCRIVVRKSGTENVVRIMIESKDREKISGILDNIVAALAM